MGPDVLLTPCKKRRCKDFFEVQAPFPLLPDEGPSYLTPGANASRRKCFVGYMSEDCVYISEESAIKALFTMGFFGRGTLTKRTPTICQDAPEEAKSSADEQEELMELSSESDSEDERHWNQKEHMGAEPSPDTSLCSRPEKERLQLTFEEAFFLSYGLGCLVVLDNEQPMDLLRMWHKFCELTPNQKFPITYTAYHHLRSKGWVVRNGLKYGTDFVLYKDGPLYYHSTYAVVVKPVKEKNLRDIRRNDRLPISWSSLAALDRVVSHSGKGLMYIYVIKPEMMSENKVATPFCVSNFKLQEVLVKRWVPSAGREEDT